MKIYTYRTILVFILAVGIFSFSSCKKMLDLDSKDVLPASKYYQNVTDANVAIAGLYGKFYDFAPRYILLNELRADLLDVTANSNEYLKQLSENSVKSNNPYADATLFYSLILNCNDVLVNFKRMKADNKLLSADFWVRYSDVASLRAWLYLQLAIHYGNVPYITDPYVDLASLSDSLNITHLSLPLVVDEQIRFLEQIQSESLSDEAYATNAMESYYDLTNSSSVDKSLGLYLGKSNAFVNTFINKKVVMADLYLWQGSYRKAATWYKKVLNSTTESDKLTFKMSSNALFQGSKDTWGDIFKSSDNDMANLYTEMVWIMPYDASVRPNYLIDLFEPRGIGEYLVKPSQASIANFQSTTYSKLSDIRGENNSYKVISGSPYVAKFSYDYDVSKKVERPGRWFLYRAALLHLRFAEAANRDGRCLLAWAFLNEGIPKAFDKKGYLSAYYLPIDNQDAPLDHTGNECSFDGTTREDPYYFLGRKGYIPYYDDEYDTHEGIRRRANATPYVLPARIITKQDSIDYIESLLLEEGALELAYEGNRWGDLVRISKRRNDPSVLANKLYDKYKLGGYGDADAKRTKLLNEDNWYLPAISFK